jgi:uncharacterized tellurite resistance protein B-like protein
MLDTLRDTATLALALAFGPDRHLTTGEVELLVDRLHARHPECMRADVQAVVVDQLDRFSAHGAAEDAAIRLEGATMDERQAVLADLAAVAEADGLVHGAEWTFVERLARRWGLPAPPRPAVRERADPLLVDLALLCVALAYGTDADLSGEEARLIRQKLLAWADLAGLEGPEAALDAALARYGTGREKEARHAAIRRLEKGLPAAVRAAVLRDLTRIANADGRFLDDEEDLLGYLSAAWGGAESE